MRISPRFMALGRSGNRLLMASEETAFSETDPVILDIIASLDRDQTAEELEESLSARHSAADIQNGLRFLQDAGLLQHGPQIERQEGAFWDSVGCSPPRGSVAFRGLCPEGRGLIQYALRSSGLAVRDDARLLLVTTDDYLRRELDEINQRDEPWLLAKPVGHSVWLGPLFIPGETACWGCLAIWMKAHRAEQAAYYGWSKGCYPPQPALAALPATVGLAAGMIATAAAVWAATGRYRDLENAITSLDTRTMRQHRSLVRRHPECTHCRRPFESPKRGPLHQFVSPLTGVVSAIQTTDEPVGGFFQALGTFAAPLPRAGVNRLLAKQHSVGKGLTAHDAEVCAIAEALERYSTIFVGDEQRIQTRAVAAIPANEILLFSEAQYEGRESWNRTHGEVQWVPERWDPDEEVEWTKVHSLVTGRAAFVPSALCYMYYDFRGGRQFCAADTNGCAAGRSLTEAKLAAVLELIERDAVAIWWYNRLCLPAVDLASLGDAKILSAAEAFRRKRRMLYVLDITTDLAVPAYVAIASRFDGSEPCFGAAAACSHREAVFKAIAEASQVCFWASVKSGSEELLSWLRDTSVNEHAYLRGHGVSVVRGERALTAAEGLRRCVDRLQAAGIEAHYLELTRAEMAYPWCARLRRDFVTFGPGWLLGVCTMFRCAWAGSRRR